MSSCFTLPYIINISPMLFIIFVSMIFNDYILFLGLYYMSLFRIQFLHLRT